MGNDDYENDNITYWRPWEVTPLWLRLLGKPNRRRQLMSTSPTWQYASVSQVAREFLKEQFE